MPDASSDYVNNLSSYFKHSWLASRPVHRFLCGSGASDCLGPSLTKPTILGGSGGGGGEGRYIENQIEYDNFSRSNPNVQYDFP